MSKELNLIKYFMFAVMFTAKIFGYTDISYWIVFLPLYFERALLVSLYCLLSIPFLFACILRVKK